MKRTEEKKKPKKEKKKKKNNIKRAAKLTRPTSIHLMYPSVPPEGYDARVSHLIASCGEKYMCINNNNNDNKIGMFQ